jgi:predicted nucleotidyltransferase
MKSDAIFRALAEHGVEYVLIGGLAAVAHGASLVTFDIDLCFRQDAANCERLAAALVELSAEVYPYRTEPIPITPQLLAAHRIINFGTPAGRLDLLAEVPGLGPYEDLAAGAVQLDLGSLSVPSLTLDQLIQAKSVLGRPKDREHLDQLLAVKRLREPG